MNEVEKDVHH